MLSEQCEVLRLWAKHLREGEPVLASDLREAADTILNLRREGGHGAPSGHTQGYPPALPQLHDQAAEDKEGEEEVIPAWAARERMFIESTMQALDGKQVYVASAYELQSANTFHDYAEWLGKREPTNGTCAYVVHSATRNVEFIGCGGVRFVVLSNRCRGIRADSIIYDEEGES